MKILPMEGSILAGGRGGVNVGDGNANDPPTQARCVLEA